MLPSSLRFRLPLSYAGIALLVALSLSIVLPIPVRDYYGRLESQYLNGNVQAIAKAIEATREVSGANWVDVVRQSQLEQLSFLSQARVQVMDADNQVIADSGPAKPRSVSLARVMITTSNDQLEFEKTGGPMLEYKSAPEQEMLTGTLPSFIYINNSGMGSAGITSSLPITKEMAMLAIRQTISQTGASDMLYTFSAVGTLFGFGLGDQVALDSWRSNQVVRYPLQDASGALWGYVQLSEGPSYGGQIVDSLTRGLFIAGGVAVLLAVAAGFLISRYISAPLTKLTEVTARMSGGDLSARAKVSRRDELGTLATSFNEMAGRVEETIYTLRSFVADAAHELNTPLTALRTDLELMDDATDAPARSRFMAQAQLQVERLQTLAAGLLDLSRMEAGTARPHTDVDVTALVRQVSETYASQAEQSGLSFNLDLPNEALHCAGDAAQLQRALGNLLDNALKFTPQGGTINLALARDDDWAEVRVEDTGIGIPLEDLPHLFSRFHRGRNAAAYPGNGLGLAIVKAIVDMHGGQVSITSTGQGACVTLRIPLCRAGC